MKILIAVVALSFIICSDADVDSNMEAVPVRGNTTECVDGIDMSEWMARSLDKITPGNISKNVKCAIKCILEDYDLVDVVTGQLLPEKVKSTFNSEAYDSKNLNKAVEECKDSKGEDPCDNTFRVLLCMELSMARSAKKE